MVSHHPKEATKEAGCNECASVAHALSSVVQSSSDSVCKDILCLRSSSLGTWCSGITSASHAEGPGLNPQCVHFLVESQVVSYFRCSLQRG